MNAITKREETSLTTIEPTSLMEVISRAASDPNTDVTKLEKLMAMAERIEARNAEQAFNVSMTDMQAAIRAIATDASNTQTKSKYATYLALDKVLRPIYTSNGFSLSFDTGDNAPENYVKVLCYVAHKAGHSRTYHADIPADGKGAKGGDVMTKTHAAGSAMSYGQRYLLKLIFNIAVGNDDDGNAAGAGAKIEADGIEKINALIAETKADIGKFCTYMKVDFIADIPEAQFGRAIAALNAKKAKK